MNNVKIDHHFLNSKQPGNKRKNYILFDISGISKTLLRYYINNIYVGSGWSDKTFKTDRIPSQKVITVKISDKKSSKPQLTVKKINLESEKIKIQTMKKKNTNKNLTNWNANGSLDVSKTADLWSIAIPNNGSKLVVKLTMHDKQSDFDIIGKWNQLPSWWVNDFFGSKIGNELINLSNPPSGKLFIRVERYSGSGRYTLDVTFKENNPIINPPLTTWDKGGKYAIIIGISDYQYINDLEYCDEDATDWFNFLTNRGYDCRVLGDSRRTNYPRFDGLATEVNVRNNLRKLLQFVKDGDTIVLITSGHGSGDGKGNSYLCLYDCKNADKLNGSYWDYEMQSDLSNINKKINTFVFIDNCYSGGMLDNLKNVPNLVAMTTCTANGYGYDDSSKQNGAWTYCFLHYTMLDHFNNGNISLQNAFKYAKESYPKATGNSNTIDQPMMLTTTNNQLFL